MDAFLPSEIARLVLGYLKEDNCLKSWQTFLEESSNLKEFFSLFKSGKVYSTNVNRYSLLDILNEYCVLKSIKKEPQTECFSSQTDIIGTLKEDCFIESTTQIVYQKYFSPSDNSRDILLTDSSSNVCELPENNRSCSKDTKDNSTDIAENLPTVKSSPDCDEHNTISTEIGASNRNKSNEQEIRKQYLENNKLKLKFDARKKESSYIHHKRRKYFLDNNCPPHSRSSFIQSLSDKLNQKESPTRPPNVTHQKHDLKNNNQPLSKPSSEENSSSSTETVLINDDDDDIEIVGEIKKSQFSGSLSLKDTTSCSNNVSANQKAIDNVVQPNTQITETRPEIDLSNNSNAEALQTKSLKDNITEQINTNDQSKIIVPESKTDSSSNQVSFVDSGTLIQSSTAVNEMPFSYPQNYILQNYAPSNAFTTNAPFYVVFNTPSALSRPIGTILTVPNVQTNTVPCPVLPAVSRTFVNNSTITPVNNFSSPLLTANIAANVDKIPLTPYTPQNEISTASSVGLSESLEPKNILESGIDDRVLSTSFRTYSKNSQISKGENSLTKKGIEKEMEDSLLPKDQLIPTPKASTLSLLEHKGEHSSKGKSKISSNSPSKNQKATKRKKSYRKKDKECKKNKKSDKDTLNFKTVKPKNSLSQSVYYEQSFPQHEVQYDLDLPNKIAETISRPKNCAKPVSSFSTSQSNYNDSTVMESSLSDVEEDRVLKVVLSDIFINMNPKNDGL